MHKYMIKRGLVVSLTTAYNIEIHSFKFPMIFFHPKEVKGSTFKNCEYRGILL